MSSRQSNGFTLVELMITVAVVAILAAIAFPSFQSTLRSNRVASASNEVSGLVALARSEAIRNKRGGGVCGSTSGTTCDGAWGKGMLAWSDVDSNGALDANEVVLRFVAMNPAITATGPNAAGITFDARGRRVGSDDKEVVLQPTSCKNQALLRRLKVNASGQISTAKETCA
ncbi:TPA: GspH/FimT family pseudopilin [Stenotrophomonas maltophilia]|nr:GspH/FimT family pseudopilin [Stenotrophomonas maltophilia]